MSRIDVEGLDYVAIQAADQSASVAWYQRLLNVQTVHDDVWGRTPTMLAAAIGRHSHRVPGTGR